MNLLAVTVCLFLTSIIGTAAYYEITTEPPDKEQSIKVNQWIHLRFRLTNIENNVVTTNLSINDSCQRTSVHDFSTSTMRVWCEKLLKNPSEYYICEDFNVLLKGNARHNNTKIGLCVIYLFNNTINHDFEDGRIFNLQVSEDNDISPPDPSRPPGEVSFSVVEFTTPVVVSVILPLILFVIIIVLGLKLAFTISQNKFLLPHYLNSQNRSGQQRADHVAEHIPFQDHEEHNIIPAQQYENYVAVDIPEQA